MGKTLSDERASSEQCYNAKLQAMIHLMYESLERLIELDAQLNTLQPIHSGRLRIQWLSYPSDECQFEGERYPAFVQWRRNFAIALWRAKKLSLSKVLKHQHKSGAFSPHAHSVRTLLIHMRELILTYRQARKTLRQLQGPSLHWIHKRTLLLQEVHPHVPCSSPREPAKDALETLKNTRS